MVNYHIGWIHEEDIPELIALLNSNEPCAQVISIFSSYVPEGIPQSTIGREAAFLIDGFRKGRYPPDLDSMHYYNFDKSEIEIWWKKRKMLAN